MTSLGHNLTSRKWVRDHQSSKDPTLEMVDRGVIADLPDILETKNFKHDISRTYGTEDFILEKKS